MIYRWMKEWGIQVASEKKMRVTATDLTESSLAAEMALFSFPLNSGGEELKPAPLVYDTDLKQKIFELLEKNDWYSMSMMLKNIK